MLQTPTFLANKTIQIHVSSGLDENGSEKIIDIVEVKARVESSSEVVFLPDGTKTKLHYKAFAFESISLSLPYPLTGFCFVDGVKHVIASTGRFMNPDGSINHLVLGLV